MTGTSQHIIDFFEALTPGQVQHLGDIYASDAYFKDPFNEVHGLAPIQDVFRHMYGSLEAPRFHVTECVAHGGQCFLVWEFRFRFKNSDREQTLRGCSHLKLGADGRIAWHRDYWDAAEEIYEKLPLLGTLMRWLKKRTAGTKSA